MNTKQTVKGFTIIEVVLVLAIAGLIFLMVFVALPALQRGQRDSARKSDVGTVASAITSYQSNNKGQSPTAGQISQYINGNTTGVLDSGITVTRRTTTYTNPITVTANLSAGSSSTSDNVLYQDQMYVYYGYKCGTSAAGSLVRGSAKQAAVLVALEAGPASGTVYCQTS
tara:strand:- start:627 stop:1136 length:510 start_codon:yes stop_codon:yes gene_type:complete